jgi:proteasome lid subunit RPN8/RPN11
MKNRSQVRIENSASAAASQTKTSQRRAAALPRKLPDDWAERYIAKEFKVVALRECPVSRDLHVCDTPEKAAEYWRLNIATNPYFNSECECLVVLILTTRRHVKGHQLVTIGTLDTVLASPREMFRAAIVASAAAIILMHNHPSGDATPSEADIKVTRDMIRAGQLLRIEVLDHVIVGQATPQRPKDYTSVRELGYFAGIDSNPCPPSNNSKREEASILRRVNRHLKHHKQHAQRRAA